jgi:hypothetical protein
VLDRLTIIAGAALLASGAAARAQGTGPFAAHAAEPAGDRWMYANNSTPGTRGTASTFSFLPFSGEDDRFGQFLIKFDTVAAGIRAGLGAEKYDVHKLVLSAVYSSNASLPYDPTEDPRASLGPAATIADPDAGRPLELHGTGFRGGFTAASFQETSPYGSTQRNAFALGFDAAGATRDVSNNVTQGFDGMPWAVGQVSEPVDLSAHVYQPLAAGASIPMYSLVTFEINLALPGVANYVRQGLHQGFLWFSLSSFHPVTGPESAGFPAYFTRDNPEQATFGDVAAMLDAEYSLPVRIIAFSRDPSGTATHLTWNGSPGFEYAVERTDDPTTGIWSKLGTFTTAVPAPLTWNGTSAPARAFFRIARSQQP